LNQVADQFSAVWKGTGFGQRLVFIVVILGFLAGLLGVTYWVRTPELGLLYSDLSQREASEVVEYLKDNNIATK
jgi:Flagellar biosynthesis/type III secretory pathway lipoprotein